MRRCCWRFTSGWCILRSIWSSISRVQQLRRKLKQSDRTPTARGELETMVEPQLGVTCIRWADKYMNIVFSPCGHQLFCNECIPLIPKEEEEIWDNAGWPATREYINCPECPERVEFVLNTIIAGGLKLPRYLSSFSPFLSSFLAFSIFLLHLVKLSNFETYFDDMTEWLSYLFVQLSEFFEHVMNNAVNEAYWCSCRSWQLLVQHPDYPAAEFTTHSQLLIWLTRTVWRDKPGLF